MKVPTAEPSVGIETPTVHPVQVPGAVPGAFGGDVAQAISKVGQDIAGVGDRVTDIGIKMADNQAKVRGAKLESQYVQGWQDRLYSADPETVKDSTGKEVTRPRGYLARIGDQVDPNMPTSMIQDNADFTKSILEQEPNPRRRAELAIKLDNHFLAIRENGISHTLSETRKAAEATFRNTSQNYIDSSTLSTNPDALKGSIANIMTNNLTHENRLGKGSQWLIQQNHDDIEKALWKATDSVLESTGDVEKAKALLNDQKLKELIPEDLFKPTEIKLEETAKRKAALVDWQNKQTLTQGAFDLSQGLVNRTLTSEQVKDWYRSGKIDLETASIFDAVVRKGAYEIPSDPIKPDNFLALLDASINDKTEVMKIIKDATTAYGKKELGDNQYSYFIQEANKKFERQSKGLQGNSAAQNILINAIKGIKAFDETYNFTNPKFMAGIFSNFIERVMGGQHPDIAKSQVMEEHLNKEIENTKLTLPPQTEKMVAPDGRIYEVAPNKVEQALKRGLKRATK